MSANIAAYNAICNNCMKQFNIGEIFTIAVNLDSMTHERDKLLAGELNKVTCPKCGKEFIYEVPMVIYSANQGLVYYVEPRLSSIGDMPKLRTPFAFMGHDFKYRIVNFQSQAREKYLIELAGLSDIAVEYIKLVSFADDIALPFDTYSLEFDSKEGDVYCFKQYDCLGDVIESFELEFPDEKIPIGIKELNPFGDKWQRINRLSMQNFKEEL